MITAIALYIVLGLAGAYGTSKAVETYIHLDDNDAERYSACIEKADKVSQCKDLE